MTRHRALHPDEASVSNVLGAILMFGLLVLTLVMIQVEFVPVWDEDREARHAQRVQDQLARMTSDLDRQAGNDTAAPLTNPLTLKRPGGFTFFSGANVGATATFVPAPAGTGVSLASANPVHILRRDGLDLFSLSPTWPPFLDDQITGVTAIQHLRERVDLIDPNGDSYLGGPPPNYADGDKVTLNVYSATDDVNPIGKVVTTYRDFPSEVGLLIQVFDANGVEVSSDVEALFQQTTFQYLYFDLLDGALFFEPILASGQAPYRLELIEDGLVADYQIAYSDIDSGGVATGAGLPEPSYAQTSESGALVVELRNQRFVDQTYVLEHGAVVLVQDGAAHLVVPPALDLSVSASTAALSWIVPGLAGDGIAQSGNRALNLVSSPSGEVDDVLLTASTLSLHIPTQYGDAWCTHFRERFQAAGLTDTGANPQFTVAATSAACQVVLNGPVSPAADLTEDISLRYRSSILDLAFAPG